MNKPESLRGDKHISRWFWYKVVCSILTYSGTHGIQNGQFYLGLNFSVLSKVEKHSRQREESELKQEDVLEPHTNSLKWLKGL